MYHCNICNKEFEKRHSYIAHCRIHSSYVRPKKLNSRRNQPPKTKCIFCGEIFTDGRKLGGHMGHCELNPKHDEIIKNMSAAAYAKNHHWSDEDKKRISEERIKYLTEHPDKVPYILNHSSKMSYPEEIFKNALESSGITGWTYNYRNGIYAYDFAFPELKIDVEIDGNTHTQDKVKRIDDRRDKYSRENNWKIIRFPAQEVKMNIMLCIKKLEEIIENNMK
jgi:very-short-patch-repair endonuclease